MFLETLNIPSKNLNRHVQDFLITETETFGDEEYAFIYRPVLPVIIKGVKKSGIE